MFASARLLHLVKNVIKDLTLPLVLLITEVLAFEVVWICIINLTGCAGLKASTVGQEAPLNRKIASARTLRTFTYYFSEIYLISSVIKSPGTSKGRLPEISCVVSGQVWFLEAYVLPPVEVNM